MNMMTTPIPSTGEELPVIGLGTYITFDVGGDERAHEDLARVVGTLFDGGGTLIDSSPMYGTAEEVVGTVLSAMGGHEKAFLATKVWTSGRRAGVKQMEKSMRLMGADVMDLMQIHNLVDWKTHLKTLRDWKDEGRIRYIGLTHWTESAHGEIAEIVKSEPVDFIQIPYSITDNQAEDYLLPLCADKGVGVLANIPFDRGHVFGRVAGEDLPGWAREFCDSWADFFLKYILSAPGALYVIPATADLDHMRANVAAGQGRLPDEKERARMIEFWQEH